MNSQVLEALRRSFVATEVLQQLQVLEMRLHVLSQCSGCPVQANPRMPVPLQGEASQTGIV
jgi:hypothetical protein